MKINIEQLYEKINGNSTSPNLRANLFFSIIQLKKNDFSLRNIHNSIYQDCKNFISEYINSVFEKDVGYDIIDTNKIKKCIDIVENKHDEYLLAQFAYRLLKLYGFEEESCKIKKIANHKKTEWIKLESNLIKKYFKLLIHLSTYSLSSILITLIVLLILTCIILLPSQSESFSLYKVTYSKYCDIFLINHLVNILTNFLGIKNDFKVETQSLMGILFIILIKIVYLLFIVNYLYKQFIELLNHK